MSHWYEMTEAGDVVPRHFVPMSSRPDELRPTRITDVRRWWKEGRAVHPSVTTVLDIINKWGLNNWRIDQHLEVAYTMPVDGEDLKDWIGAVKNTTELNMDKAPSAGTDIHDKLERFMTNELSRDDADYHLCEKVISIIEAHTAIERQHFTTERNFVSPLGFGGQVDLSHPGWVIDYKSKQTADKFKPKKMVFDEHYMQLGAYREGLGLPDAKTANVFVCLENGEVDFHEHTEAEIQRGWQMFERALALWQLQNNVELAA